MVLRLQSILQSSCDDYTRWGPPDGQLLDGIRYPSIFISMVATFCGRGHSQTFFNSGDFIWLYGGMHWVPLEWRQRHTHSKIPPLKIPKKIPTYDSSQTTQRECEPSDILFVVLQKLCLETFLESIFELLAHSSL